MVQQRARKGRGMQGRRVAWQLSLFSRYKVKANCNPISGALPIPRSKRAMEYRFKGVHA